MLRLPAGGAAPQWPRAFARQGIYSFWPVAAIGKQGWTNGAQLLKL